jgi:O-antigen/teichoic acid export membrane protein
MNLLKNITANYAGVIVAAASPVFALPIYLAALGTTRWGLVSFATTLASVFSILEVGLSQRLVRDLTIAKLEDPNRAARAFRGIAACYWLLGCLAATVLLAAQSCFVGHWLRLKPESIGDGYATVYFAAVLIITQIPNSAYRSALLSTDRHVMLNAQVGSFSICKHVAGVIVAMVWKDLRYVYVAYSATAVAELAVRGWTATRAISPANAGADIDWAASRTILAAGAKMSVAVIAGLLTLQSDRLFLSRFASLHDLGVYGVATSLGYGVLQLTYPLFASVTPALSLVANDPIQLRARCSRLLKGVCLALLLAIACYLLIGESLVRFWLKNASLFMEVRPILRLFLLGNVLNIVYQVSYVRWLVMGRIRPIVVVNVVSLLLAVTVTPALIAAYGTIGAAGSWITINIVGVLANVSWMLGNGQKIVKWIGSMIP